jgi:hypothetical protein
MALHHSPCAHLLGEIEGEDEGLGSVVVIKPDAPAHKDGDKRRDDPSTELPLEIVPTGPETGPAPAKPQKKPPPPPQKPN